MKIKWTIIGYVLNEMVWLVAAYISKSSYIWYELGGMLFYFVLLIMADVLYGESTKKEEEKDGTTSIHSIK